MSKYVKLQTEIFSIFGNDSWIAASIPTYPSNYIAVDKPNKYIRVSVISNGSGLNFNSTSGVLIIDIFTPAGNGPNESMLIADALDMFLAGKTIGTTQLFVSSLGSTQKDSANPALSMTIYTIPFKHFGVLS